MASCPKEEGEGLRRHRRLRVRTQEEEEEEEEKFVFVFLRDAPAKHVRPPEGPGQGGEEQGDGQVSKRGGQVGSIGTVVLRRFLWDCDLRNSYT